MTFKRVPLYCGSMNTQTLMLLQSIVAGLHLLNAGLASVTKSPVAALACGTVLVMLQTYLQNAGNQSAPPINPPPPGATIKAATSIDGNVSVSDPKPTPTEKLEPPAA